VLHLTNNKVGIIPIADPDKVGHIWIPEQAKERTDQGVVKYVAANCEHVKIGDYVIFSGYSGSALLIVDPATHQQERLIIIPEDYVSAIIDDPPLAIPGLYLLGRDGYFPATFEAAMELIADAYSRQEWAPLQIKSGKLGRGEYKMGV
jgi:co-chaperonin GroES (HSP10)